ncbi:MAG: exosortase/archaeosortase family protein [Chloroflexi bacterium]|nr:MAG: exosortase/archaeosortase family protein [Chloroflexota bacterium]TME15116.1 MAG: exosortase/archaeosortase family protein [Chloroflexota bacterium]
MTREDTRFAQLTLLAGAGLILLALPFVTTYNDFLTEGAIRLGVAGPLQAVGPVEARMVVTLLRLIGVHAGASGSDLVVWDFTGRPTNLFISWNCIGWQSLVLLGVSLSVGLRGPQGGETRAQVVLTGLLGTVLVNLLRVALVCLLAAVGGRVPAIVFHDYGGTALIVLWLFAFWAFANRFLLHGQGEPEAVA